VENICKTDRIIFLSLLAATLTIHIKRCLFTTNEHIEHWTVNREIQVSCPLTAVYKLWEMSSFN